MNKTAAPKFKLLVSPLPESQYALKAPYAMINPIGITIHETDNNASARNEIAYMQRNNNSTSFHFAVDENEIIQGVPLDRNSWHAGDGRNGKGNRQTISVEIARNYRTDNLTNYYKARNNAELVVGWLMFVYGFDKKDIYTHKDWNGKNCPRVIFRENYLDKFKQSALNVRNSYSNLATPGLPASSFEKFKENQVVKIKYTATTYANVNKQIPSWVKNKNHTILKVSEPTGQVLLKEIYSWVKMSDIVGYTSPQTPAKPVAPKPAAPTPTAPQKTKIEKGSYVKASGGVYLNSYGQGYGGTTTVVGKITHLNEGASKPYHVGSTGWFAASDVKLVDETTVSSAAKTFNVGDRVYVSGQVHRDSAGNGPGAVIKRYGVITYKKTGAAKPYHIDNVGWVAAKDVK